ncbi:hypothetical protein IGS74_18050 [Aureimonas sp. OT7]|uniref:hypothetical protein n=1 Tax=Aureimonas sp. OT7 TaxID=2816454 RepID=UPI00178343D6|nr:hypothetical protein [Aureimonas sp. OT7]QOG06405.1 hypothetical protein IGS74_18050 [Aureimonas sp. OT7]
MLEKFLSAAADGDDPARNISEALAYGWAFPASAIDNPTRSRIIFAAVRAAIVACETFPNWVPRDHIRKGFRSFLEWLDPEPVAYGLQDRKRWVRILRNAAHSSALLDELADDAFERRSQTIQALARPA